MQKPLRLGIVGAENSHSWAIAEVCNKRKKVPLRVTHLWGETPETTIESAEKGGIPNIVENWKDIAPLVDGVMIDHRDGRLHAEVARFFINRRVPVFVDKPFTCSLREAQSLLSLAKKFRSPITTFGIVPFQRRFKEFSKKIGNEPGFQFLDTIGPADINDPHGGIFFYGFHQVDAAIELMGSNFVSASLRRSGNDGVAMLFDQHGQSTVLRFLASDWRGFHFRARSGSSIVHLDAQFDSDPYLCGAKILSRFLHTKVSPFSEERMLAPIAVLAALQKSLRSGKHERIGIFR